MKESHLQSSWAYEGKMVLEMLSVVPNKKAARLINLSHGKR